MPFTLVPVQAHRIDVSSVTDIERERLKVTLSGGYTFTFAVDLTNSRKYPRLLLDKTQFCNRELLKEYAQLFYRKCVYRNWLTRFAQWVRSLVDSNYHVRFRGWTYETVVEKLEIQVWIGNESRPTPLEVGRRLEIHYSTNHSNPVKESTPWTWGEIIDISSEMIAPTSMVTADA